MREAIAYIIPGFDEHIDAAGYQEIADLFIRHRIPADIIRIGWKNRTVSSYIKNVLKIISPARFTYVLGFSMGAMVAAIAASQIKIDQLFLCSLSPYFKDDLSHLTQEDQRTLGKRRVSDFKKYSFPAIAQRIRCSTTIFEGSGELSVLRKRCEIASHEIQNAKLIQISNAGHSISNPHYRDAIASAIQQLKITGT